MKPKTIIISSIVGGVVVVLILAAVLIFTVFKATSPLTDAADEFFTHLSQKDFDKAYQLTSLRFQRKVPRQDFEEIMLLNHFCDYKESSWNSRKFENDRGEIKGSITTRSGKKIPIIMNLIKETDGWKVNFIDLDSEAGMAPAKEKEIPPMEECTELTTESMGWFLTAVEDENFDGLWSKISKLWQKEITPEKLEDIFSIFNTRKEQLSAIEQGQPVLSEQPSFEEHGWLVLVGYYPVEPQITYKLTFVMEDSEWKLAGIKVRIE